MRFLLLILLLVAHASYAAKGTYIQAQTGVGGLYTKDYSAEDNPYDNTSMQNSLPYRLSLGYLWEKSLLEYGIEAGYQNLPENRYAFSFPSLSAYGYQKYTANNIDLLMVALYRFAIAPSCYFIGKIGAARISQTLKGQTFALNTFFNANETNNQIKLEAVAGAGYELTSHINADVSYQHIFGNTADPAANSGQLNSVSSVNTLMLALSYHFDPMSTT